MKKQSPPQAPNKFEKKQSPPQAPKILKKQAPRLVASSLLAGRRSAQGWLRAPYSPGPNPPKAGCELPTRRAQIRRQNDLSACLLVGIKLFCPGKKTAPPHQETAAGFGPEIQFPHLSLAFSLILSGVSQNEVSFGKKIADCWWLPGG